MRLGACKWQLEPCERFIRKLGPARHVHDLVGKFKEDVKISIGWGYVGETYDGKNHDGYIP